MSLSSWKNPWTWLIVKCLTLKRFILRQLWHRFFLTRLIFFLKRTEKWKTPHFHPKIQYLEKDKCVCVFYVWWEPKCSCWRHLNAFIIQFKIIAQRTTDRVRETKKWSWRGRGKKKWRGSEWTNQRTNKQKTNNITLLYCKLNAWNITIYTTIGESSMLTKSISVGSE